MLGGRAERHAGAGCAHHNQVRGGVAADLEQLPVGFPLRHPHFEPAPVTSLLRHERLIVGADCGRDLTKALRCVEVPGKPCVLLREILDGVHQHEAPTCLLRERERVGQRPAGGGGAVHTTDDRAERHVRGLLPLHRPRHGQHGTGRLPQRLLRDGPEQQPFEPAGAVRAHDDQIRGKFPRNPQDFCDDRAF